MLHTGCSCPFHGTSGKSCVHKKLYSSRFRTKHFRGFTTSNGRWKRSISRKRKKTNWKTKSVAFFSPCWKVMVSIVIIVKFEPRTPRSFENMVDYMFDPHKTDAACTFGIGINSRCCKYEWWLPWMACNILPDELSHHYVQVIVSLETMPIFCIPQWLPIFYEIGCSLITDRRQVLGSIHFKGNGHVHCHYLINYVSMEGTLYRQLHQPMYYRKKIEEIICKNLNSGRMTNYERQA